MEYDKIDTQVVDTTLQIFPAYFVATFTKMVVSTSVFIASVYHKNGTIFGMFDNFLGVFNRDQTGELRLIKLSYY